MSKAKTLASAVSTGGALANPTAIPAANIAGLATVATTGSYTDLSDKPTITTTATNLAGGSAGSVPYQSAAGATAMLAAGTAGQVLTSAGAAAPGWSIPAVTAPGGTTGQVQINNAGAFGAVASGTSGQVLTSAGAGAAPTFATPAAGGSWVLLSTVIANDSATVDIENTFNSTYDRYVIVATDVLSNAYTGVLIRMHLKIGGVYQTSGYVYHAENSGAQSVAYSAIAERGATFIQIGGGVGAEYGNFMAFNLNIVSPTSSARKMVHWDGVCDNTEGATVNVTYRAGAGMHSSTLPLTGVRFLSHAGGVSGGFRLYGIKKS